MFYHRCGTDKYQETSECKETMTFKDKVGMIVLTSSGPGEVRTTAFALTRGNFQVQR